MRLRFKKLYVKMKESGPLGGTGGTPLDPLKLPVTCGKYDRNHQAIYPYLDIYFCYNFCMPVCQIIPLVYFGILGYIKLINVTMHSGDVLLAKLYPGNIVSMIV